MALRQSVSTDQAPEAIGPYSQGIRSGSLLFCSGQIPLDPSTGEIVKEDVEGQTRRCLENLTAVCEAAGGSRPDDADHPQALDSVADRARRGGSGALSPAIRSSGAERPSEGRGLRGQYVAGGVEGQVPRNARP